MPSIGSKTNIITARHCSQKPLISTPSVSFSTGKNDLDDRDLGGEISPKRCDKIGNLAREWGTKLLTDHWFLPTGALILPIAALLDYTIGDPWGWPHPVQAIGAWIAAGTETALKRCPTPRSQRIAGVVLALSTIAIASGYSWAIVRLASQLHPSFGIACASLLLASCFAGRSLRRAAEDVLQPLLSGDLDRARDRLRLYVGRDTDNLSPPEIWRAVLETLSENAVDGVTAPLFYAAVGATLPGVGPVPIAFAYKAASTLDSMVGYRDAPYTHLGWFSANLEDRLTWLPCRLTVLTLGAIAGQLRYVWQTCQRDATQDPSPNAGWSECAYAAILGVRLGGLNTYRGVPKPKPLLGEPKRPISEEVIREATQLTRSCFLIWLAIAVGLAIALGASFS